MKPYVIVTVQDPQKTFAYDVEVPTDVEVGKLADDIAEVINSYSRKNRVPSGVGLACFRLKKKLNPAETFAEAGIWTGDTLVIE